MRSILIGMVLTAVSTSALADDMCFKFEDAAYRGANAEVEALIAQGAKVNCQFADGWTALMHAVFAKKADTVKLLLAKGADPNQKRKDGVTALAMAKAHLVLAMGDTSVTEAKALIATLKTAGAKQ